MPSKWRLLRFVLTIAASFVFFVAPQLVVNGYLRDSQSTWLRVLLILLFYAAIMFLALWLKRHILYFPHERSLIRELIRERAKLAMATEFLVCNHTSRRAICVRRVFGNGKRWRVTYVPWEWEPLPSSQKVEFDSFDEALAAARDKCKSIGGNGDA